MKLGEKLKCPKCQNETFNLVLEHISQEDFEGEMFGITCMECGYRNAYLDGDALAALEMERTYIEEELSNIKNN